MPLGQHISLWKRFGITYEILLGYSLLKYVCGIWYAHCSRLQSYFATIPQVHTVSVRPLGLILTDTFSIPDQHPVRRALQEVL